MFKKACAAIAGVLALSLALVGCSGSSKTPEELAKSAQQEIIESQYMDADLDLTIGMASGGMSVELTATGEIKLDNTGDIQVYEMDMTMKAMGQSAKTQIVGAEDGTYTTTNGDTEFTEYTDDKKAELEQANMRTYNSAMLDNATVTEEKEDDKTVVTVVPDKAVYEDYLRSVPFLEQLALSFTESDWDSIKSLQASYVFDKDDQLEEVSMNIEMEIDGETMTMEVTIKINSIDEKVEITPPSTKATTAA